MMQIDNIEIQDKDKYRSLPAIALEAVSLLDLFITKSMRVFEWGAGGSTIFFAERAKTVYTIEHDAIWFDIVKKALDYRDLSNCYLRVVKREITGNYRAYSEAIRDYPDDYFDLIMVDGRSRVACIVDAIPKLKRHGMIVLDNSDRGKYKHGLLMLREKGWHRLDFKGTPPYSGPGYQVQTSLWYRD
jgi:predicted O-methyltransferase YrrM